MVHLSPDMAPPFGFACILFLGCAFTRAADVSNVVPRLDQDGRIVNAHEGNIFFFENTYWYFGVAYPPCTGACAACNASEACCTFENNTLTVLSSPDLSHWTLVSSNLLPGVVENRTVFLPSAAYSAATEMYALTWVEPGLDGARVATAPHPGGPWNVSSFLPLILPPSSTIALWTDPATGTGYVRYNAARGVPQPPMNASDVPPPPGCNVTGYWYANCPAGGPWAWDFFGAFQTRGVLVTSIHNRPSCLPTCHVAIEADAAGRFGPGSQPNYWGVPWNQPLEMRGTTDEAAGSINLDAPTTATGTLQASQSICAHNCSHIVRWHVACSVACRLRARAPPRVLVWHGMRPSRPACGAATRGARAMTWRRLRKPTS